MLLFFTCFYLLIEITMLVSVRHRSYVIEHMYVDLPWRDLKMILLLESRISTEDVLTSVNALLIFFFFLSIIFYRINLIAITWRNHRATGIHVETNEMVHFMCFPSLSFSPWLTFSPFFSPIFSLPYSNLSFSPSCIPSSPRPDLMGLFRLIGLCLLLALYLFLWFIQEIHLNLLDLYVRLHRFIHIWIFEISVFDCTSAFTIRIHSHPYAFPHFLIWP